MMERIKSLIMEVIKANGEAAGADGLPTGAFMAHRPNSLTESYQHGLAVAKILADWQAEPALQMAGLLHSFVCKGVLPVEQIAEVSDERTAFLCQKYADILQQPQRHGKLSANRRVKLYIAAYCDPALAFLGVASLWDHFILARQSEPTLQRIFAEEAQEVLIPLLDLLGMAALQTEVEEWLMRRVQNQQDYQYLLKRLAQTEDSRAEAFKLVKAKLEPVLPAAQLAWKRQTPTQIYNPKFSEKAHPEALQQLRVDLLVETEEACYMALRWIHRLWQPVEYSLVDHIGMSEVNGDRYLLTAVVVPQGNSSIRVHFNIRTHEMEQINQWGLAALLMRERHRAELPQAWWSQREEGYQKICSAALGTLPETFYVFSPHGEIFCFYRGCTVVDYAFQVHSEVAHQCKRFKINGEVVGPAAPLHHLDLIELEQDPQFPGPNRAWLHAARTNRARSQIERFLKRQVHDHKQGRVVLERQLQQLVAHYRIDIPGHHLEQALHQAAQRLNFERLESLLAEIAAGRVSTSQILHPLFSEEVVRQIDLPREMRLPSHQLSLAQCCKPRPGDDIVGRAHYRAGIVTYLKIHRADCLQINQLQGAIELKWRLQPKLNAVARLEMAALAKPNLLYDALSVFQADAPQATTLHKVDAVVRHGTAYINFTVEAKDQQVIDRLNRGLETLAGHQVNEVRQMQLLFSEREELVKPLTPAGFNPYRRQPVRNREMFFGRAEELAQIYEMLQAGAGVIFIQGQKRMGKTSLLLYLKRYYLNRRLNIPVFIDFQMLGQLNPPAIYYEIARAVYNDLQVEPQMSDLGPPLQELFESNPTHQLMAYLRSVQSCLGGHKLVLLIDEFSRTIDAYQQNRLDETLFLQWRGLIQVTTPQISYVMVIQQQSYDYLRKHRNQATLAPIWHLLEMGETRLLRPLSAEVARQLIERPTYNHLEYSAEALQQVWRLTGGSPFLIQAFCYNLVRYMAHTERRRVEQADVQAVQVDFMHANESLFAHLVDVVQSSPLAMAICKQLAKSLSKTEAPISLAELEHALAHIPAERLQHALHRLSHQYILVEPEPEQWQFASLLFGRWLAANTLPDSR
jgi:GTP pyrophosphokinase